MENNTIGTYVPSEEEMRATFDSYISRIYSILVNYEATKKINKEFIKFLCFEIQSYAHIIGNDKLLILPSKLIGLLVDDIQYSYVRKIVLDSTNYLTRLKG